MLIPETLDYAAATKLLPTLTPLEIAATAFLENEDYFQNGTQYIGPQAAPGDPVGKQYIEQSFVALAKLGELTRRYVAGTVGQEPSFEVIEPDTAPDAKPSELKAEVDSAMGAWFDNELVAETTELFAGRLCATLGAYYHFGVPPGLLQNATMDDGSVQTIVQANDFADALDFIYCEAPATGTAATYTDADTRQEYGVYSYSETIGTKVVKCLEVSWCAKRDENGEPLPVPLTHVLILKDDKSAPRQFTIDTGGVPLVVGATFHPLVFAALASRCNISLNNAINAVCTMVKINADVAGFPEKNHVDIYPPTEDSGRKDDTGKPIEIAVDAVTGPRTAPFHMSVVDESVNQDNQVVSSARSGTIIYRPPVSSGPLLEVARFYLRALYESANQAHVLEVLSPDSSGVARVEARADFARALLKIARKVEGAQRDLLRGVRCFAAYLGNDPRLEAMKAMRDNVTAHPHSGPLTADEKRLVLEMVAAEVISHELAATMLGIEDVAAELAKIAAERNLRDFGEPGAFAGEGGDDAQDDDATPIATGADGASVAGVATALSLNGAQFDAATKALLLLSGGILVPSAATQLLVAVGIEESTAQDMIDKQGAQKLTPEQLAAAGV